MLAGRLRMIGVPGSPYSRKLRAALRYRRIPHDWILFGAPEARNLPRPRVALLPQLIVPGPGETLEVLIDSSPILRELERSWSGRELTPPDPLLAFLDFLLEDYADEWLTKAMFHYRWAFAADVAQASALLPRWTRTDQPEEEARAQGVTFAQRQRERRAVVGSNPTTAPTIEESYRRLLLLLDDRLRSSRFVMGARPGTSDFGLYGQLTQLAGFDPTPRTIALALAPRVVAWVDVMEDLSGLEPEATGWLDRSALACLRPLLTEIGRVYAPFLVANDAALRSGAARVECEIDGRPWVQRPFPYQGKCLAWLREAHAGLSSADRSLAAELLAGTGCEALFAAP